MAIFQIHVGLWCCVHEKGILGNHSVSSICSAWAVKDDTHDLVSNYTYGDNLKQGQNERTNPGKGQEVNDWVTGKKFPNVHYLALRLVKMKSDWHFSFVKRMALDII